MPISRPEFPIPPSLLLISSLFLSVFVQAAGSSNELDAEDVRQIVKEAYVYANPVVDNYRIYHAYYIDRNNSEFKAPWNHLFNQSRVSTHEDRVIQTPNSDTPYSLLGMDLRTEPLVLTVPPLEAHRYFSIQLNDLYTHIFGYIGTRTTGNDGGSYLVAGPFWQGQVPEGITKVYRSETELAMATYRTQLFNPEDIEKVRAIQAQYRVLPLSAFLGETPPHAAPPVDFIKPLAPDELRTSLDVFSQLNFLLQFCPPESSEKELMARFAKIGIGRHATFDPASWTPEWRHAAGQGIVDAWADFMLLKKQGELGEVTSGDIFGSRAFLKNNYLYRMGAAVIGIYGNSAEEALYRTEYSDSTGQVLDGSHTYIQRFEPGQLPPVKAFWSLTMYRMPESLLAENTLNRYLLNSTMLDTFVRDEDGAITFYLQHESPGVEKEPNWLPAPKGPFNVTLRMYWPEAAILDRTWKAPPVIQVE